MHVAVFDNLRGVLNCSGFFEDFQVNDNRAQPAYCDCCDNETLAPLTPSEGIES